MACTPADDAYLIQLFPGVVITVREDWLVTILLASEGTYTVTLKGVPYAFEAPIGASLTEIRDGLQNELGGQLFAAINPVGVAGLQIEELGTGGLGLTVEGPIADSMSATLTAGGDANEALRIFWLANTLCFLPPCCAFVCCPGDYTMMHAAIAAHFLFTMGALNSAGGGANDFDSMKLGPAALNRGSKTWGAVSPADGDLAKTAPGQLYLMIRSKYVFGVVCV
jgi:hypothetical protein